MKLTKTTVIKTTPARLGGGMKVSGTSIKHSKRRGEWAEMRFMARASEHGFSVSKPWGESEAYDLIVVHQGRLLRVQVKSTTFRRSNSYICQLRGYNKPAYTSHEVDFVAVYVIPKNVWFIFPIDVVLGGRDLTLSPHLEGSKNAAYEEAWDLMRGGNAASDEYGHVERG